LNREKQKETLKEEQKFLQQMRERKSREPPARDVLREREILRERS
jgi:hypothetical protein